MGGRPPLTLFRHAWAGIWSLVGLLLAPTFAHRRIVDGVLVCDGATWPRRLGWRYRAITFGHVILCVDRIDERTFTHEMAHVRQYETWGPLFIPAYLIASLQAMRDGGHFYADNRFEIAARLAERTHR